MISAPASANSLCAFDKGDVSVSKGAEDHRYLSSGGAGSCAWSVVPRPPSRMRIGGLLPTKSESDIFMVCSGGLALTV